MSGLRTRWADDVDPAAPLPEHPRPQLHRPTWRSLNGWWEHAVTDGAAPAVWSPIVVPFSPEAPLSRSGRPAGWWLRPGEVLFYRRTLRLDEVPPGTDDARILLHLGAVDQVCEVTVDGTRVGGHTGGFLPLTCDLTDVVTAARTAGRGHVVLGVRVTDDTDATWRTRGKQRSWRGGIWYSPQSGIWQSVWLETVPADGVGRLVLTPHLDPAEVEVLVEPLVSGRAPASATVVLITGDSEVARAEVPVGRPTRIAVPSPRLWSPDDPHLYDVTVRCGSDEVTSYVGLRSIALGEDAHGTPRILFNGEPVFQVGVLDQGYWPDGLLTAPTDEALLADVVATKELGFTMSRKHIKVEPLRWYHHCDRVGLLVWQDMPNGGGRYTAPVISAPAVLPVRLPDRGPLGHRLFGRGSARGRAEFRAELTEMVEHLRSVTSLVVWVPFNEGWGQFDAARVAEEVRRLDPSRLVDHASGWHDQVGGDLVSWHVYFRRFRMRRRRAGDCRAAVLSEYGGYNLRVDGHVWGEKNFGYRKQASAGALLARFTRLHAEEIAPAIPDGLCAVVYTQLTDVEDELNGLLTYDRVDKLDRADVRRVLRALR